MDEAQSPHPTKLHPLLLRLVLWPLILAALLWQFARGPTRISDAEFQFAGNRTNLYAALVAQPAAEATSGAMFCRRLDAMRKWSMQVDRPQDEILLQTIAWQEDLIALYASGGMFFIGPSDFDFQGPPSVGWRPVAAAVDERTLMVVGLSAEGKPVFSRLNQKGQWGTEEAVDVVVDWTAETAHVARAAVREDQFHVVWTEPIASGPLGGRPGDRLLRFAWREPSGKWKGPFTAEFQDRNQTRYVVSGPVSVAALAGELGMLCAVRPASAAPAADIVAPSQAAAEDKTESKESAEAAASDDKAPTGDEQLVYARFYPSDGQWHIEWEVKLPLDLSSDVQAYGLARFRDRLVAAACDGQEVRPFVLVTTPETSAAGEDLPPVQIALPVLAERDSSWIQTALMVAAMIAVTAFAVRGYRQRVMPRPGIPDDEYRWKAARAAAYQVEKLMYLPILLRRSAAFVLDMVALLVLYSMATLVIIFWRWPDLFLHSPEIDPTVLLNRVLASMPGLVFLVTLLAYFTATELLLGRTPGKMICGLTIVDLSDRRPAWWRIVDRNLMRPIELLWIPVGLLVILWTPRSQRIGDLLGGTRVVIKATRTDRPTPNDRHVL